jgi:hypothetical protein
VRKFVFVVLGMFVASFALGRADSLRAHRGCGGSVAAAQSLDDSTGADAIDSHATPPAVAGNYSGNVTDHKLGMGTISVDLTQHGSKLSGTWTTDLPGVGGGSLSGTVKPNGKIHLKLSITGLRHCAENFQGMFENGDEIAGVYHTNGCRGADHGMVDVTD